MGVIAEIVQSDYEIIYNCKSTHIRTSPLATEIQKNGISSGFAAQGASHPSSPTRRGGAKQIEAQRPGGL